MYKIVAICVAFLICASAWVYAAPEIIAHRCGAKELPENTLFAMEKLVVAGIATIEIDVQVTSDGAPVLYHADNLQKLGLIGQIKDYTYQELAKRFWVDERFPKERFIVPLLEDVLAKFSNVHLIIDFKSLPQGALVDSVIAVINKHAAWDRVVFYSTDDIHIQLLKQKTPKAVTFERRFDTRARLLNMMAANKCIIHSEARWLGFERIRELKVTEFFKLGEGSNKIEAYMWTQEAVACTRQQAPNAYIVWFGVNDTEAYKDAGDKGIDAVFTDVPLFLLKYSIDPLH